MGRLPLSDYLELYVCIILTVEFVYDYLWNSREARNKRRKRQKKEFEGDKLCVGEMQ